MQFSGQDCVKQNKNPLPLGHHLSSLLNTYHQINVGPTNIVIESLLPFVGFTSSQCARCLEGQVENFKRDI